MIVTITGGTGFIATVLAQQLLDLGKLTSNSNKEEEISQIILFDHFIPDAEEGKPDFLANFRRNPKVKFVTGDVSDIEAVRSVLSAENETVSVFHLASILSGQGEVDFELCLKVNLDGTRNLLTVLKENYLKTNIPQKLIFSSTNAVFGPVETINDDSEILPQTTYGATKACCERLISDYTRKGFIIGAGCRLPSVLVRPIPNTAASNCFNAISREPLKSEDYVLPVPWETRHPITGKQSVARALIALHNIVEGYEDKLGIQRFVVFPALSLTMKEMYDFAKKVGEKHSIKVGNVTQETQEKVVSIVKDWPPYVDYSRAQKLGLPDDIDFEEILEEFVASYVKK